MVNKKYTRGLILVKPYGSLVINKKKTAIVKTKNIKTITNTPLLLIEGKLAIGIVQLSDPKKINLKIFNRTRPSHLISTKDRMKWWPSYTTFYSYRILFVNKFRVPAIINYRTGPQITIKPSNIIFKPISVGMSGYYYSNCYPNCKKNYLECYSKYFSTVEINNTFYHMPSEALVNNLKSYPNMSYSIKVSRQITHNKKLNDVGGIWSEFYSRLANIRDKITCFLFQFCRLFHATDVNVLRLRKLGKILNKSHNYVFEFRHNSWFGNSEVNRILDENGWTMVIANEANLFEPELKKYTVTSNILYFRMHGSRPDYQGKYSTSIFNKIIVSGTNNNINKIFVYFDNTDSTVDTPQGKTIDAFNDAKRFRSYINKFNVG